MTPVLDPAASFRDRLPHLRRHFRPRIRVSAFTGLPVALACVILLFFLFFVLQASFVLQPGVVVELPQVPVASGARYGSMVVTVMPGERFFFEDEMMTAEGLQRALARRASESPEAALVIESDQRVTLENLLRVYSIAARCHIREVVLATRPGGAGWTP